MDLDISGILDDWPYEQGQLSVRKIVGRDEREKIQLRLDLGLLQMEATGRPDGKKPFGHDGLLEYWQYRLRHYEKTHGSAEGFILDPETCEKLRAEAMMYYHRYLACFVLEDYDQVKEDTRRNLKVFDFCARFAREESDRKALEVHRPYVLMMNTRARVHLALQRNRPRRALQMLRDGIDRIREHYHRMGRDEEIHTCKEIAILDAMEADVEAAIPKDPIEHMEEQLDQAIREERYEEAAALRDQLRRFEIRRQEPRQE
jgi:hypothetical protein